MVSPNIYGRPARGGNPPEVWGEAEVCGKFDLDRVQQVIDYLGMMGDAVDNIPGLPGVGAKTASKLLSNTVPWKNAANAHETKVLVKIRDNAELGILQSAWPDNFRGIY